MPEYSISAMECTRFIREVWIALGLSREDAETWAELLVETSLTGVDSHGIRMLTRYVACVENGGIDIRGVPEILLEREATAAIDAHGAIGYLSALMATEKAVEKAKKYGTGCVNVRNVNHIGACGLYARRAAKAGCIGIVSVVSKSGMAPWGGISALLGTDPIAIAAPIQGKPDFLLDISTSVVAAGKVIKAFDSGGEIPPGWVQDEQGNPITHPTKGYRGTLMPLGDHKGYGLAMVVEILTAGLGGGVFASELFSWVTHPDRPMGASLMVICLDIGHFQDPGTFGERLADWVSLLTDSPRKDGNPRILYPGLIEAETAIERGRSGIPLEPLTHDQFLELAKRLEVPEPDVQKN